MKNPWLNNWRAKLASFIIALLIWAYVRGNLVDPSFFDRVLTGTFTPGR